METGRESTTIEENKDYENPFFEAIKKNSLQMIENALVNPEHDPNYVSQAQLFPLLYAILKGRTEIALRLIKDSRVNINLERKGVNAFWLAASSGNLEVVKELFLIGANAHSISENGTNAIYEAAKNNHLPVVEYLHSMGFSIEYRKKNGPNVLGIASYEGHINVVKFLVSKGATISSFLLMKKGNIPSQLTPLYLATRRERLDIVELFLTLKPKLLFNEFSPVFLAAKKNMLDMMKLFLKHKINITTLNKKGESILMIPMKSQMYDMTKLILKESLIHHRSQLKKLVNLEDKSLSMSPLQYACRNTEVDIVKLMIEAGALVDPQNPINDWDKFLSCNYVIPEIVTYIRLLIEKEKDNIPIIVNDEDDIQIQEEKKQVEQKREKSIERTQRSDSQHRVELFQSKRIPSIFENNEKKEEKKIIPIVKMENKNAKIKKSDPIFVSEEQVIQRNILYKYDSPIYKSQAQTLEDVHSTPHKTMSKNSSIRCQIHYHKKNNSVNIKEKLIETSRERSSLSPLRPSYNPQYHSERTHKKVVNKSVIEYSSPNRQSKVTLPMINTKRSISPFPSPSPAGDPLLWNFSFARNNLLLLNNPSLEISGNLSNRVPKLRYPKYRYLGPKQKFARKGILYNV